MAVLILTLTWSVVTVTVAPRASASLADRITGSWNMRGESNGDGSGPPESRWQTGIPAAFRDEGIQVLALQEAGNQPPPGATWTQRTFPEPGITEWVYNIGTDSRPDPLYIYWLVTEQQRNGVAIVTREHVTNAVPLQVHSHFGTSRPMMGVQIGTDWYFTGHALSLGQDRANDAPDMIETARQFMAPRGLGEEWMVIADFNQEPARMPAQLQNHIIAVGQATHAGGAELDFAYASNGNNNTIHGELRGGSSDHAMLRFADVNHPNCYGLQRRSTAALPSGCLPVPGQYYKMTSRTGLIVKDYDSGGILLANDDPKDLSKRDAVIQILFGSAPGTFVLRFYDGHCMSQTPDHHVDQLPCDTENPEQLWDFSQGDGRVSDPDGGDVQPQSETIPPMNLRVFASAYSWSWVETDASGGGDIYGLRVMPLGDSITFGLGSSNGAGYRGAFYSGLQKRSASVDFVGSQRSGDMADPDNEGHSGWMIQEIADVGVTNAHSMRPNVIALHVGTNDNDHGEPSGAGDRLASMINRLQDADPDVTILLATLVPSANPVTEEHITSYNQEVRATVLKEVSDGGKVVLADMGAVTQSDLADGLHPNDSGYAKMAEAFLDAADTAVGNGWITSPAGDSDDNSPGVPGSCPTRGGGWIEKGRVATGVGASPGDVRFADIDGDGRDDFLVVGANGSVDAWRNLGGDTPGKNGWEAMGRIALGVVGKEDGLQFADIDGDGLDDYLVTHQDGSVNEWHNDGGNHEEARGWTEVGRIATGVTEAKTGTVIFADINGDHRDDYLVVGSATEVWEWENNGGDRGDTNGWISRGKIATGVGQPGQQVIFSNVTCDAQADYVLLGTGGSLKAWQNLGGDREGQAGWLEMGQIATGVTPNGVVHLADLNGDGLDDYLVVTGNEGVLAWINDGGDR